MRAVGIRKLDGLGRIVLPKELRSILGLIEGTPMDVLLDDDGNVILRESTCHCILCGSNKTIWTENGKSLCSACIEKISRRKESFHVDKID
ncbi:AbrB/MazE/SpoVT family DNA-binding domain-containing protein [Caproicibacter sp. BJN0012]|uniref:AbrB/MazE/SpoVT family DNA-binding domain-containing protein n=1 Tax=Caproicibacter sp. BJN0012 TaxID=3110227 RepID=UPI002E1306F3